MYWQPTHAHMNTQKDRGSCESSTLMHIENQTEISASYISSTLL